MCKYCYDTEDNCGCNPHDTDKDFERKYNNEKINRESAED
jgi:hypothetical protein